MLDHLVYATPDLAATVADLERRWHVAFAEGGRHVGRGTRNHLLSLGAGSYLEVIGPDPDQVDPSVPRPFGIDALTAPRLVTWAVRVADIEARAAALRAAGSDPGPVTAMQRVTPDGTTLSWRLTMPGGDGVVPFLIEWNPGCPHPSTTAPGGVSLARLSASHPDPAAVGAALAVIGADVAVEHAEHAGLAADLVLPDGVDRLV